MCVYEEDSEEERRDRIMAYVGYINALVVYYEYLQYSIIMLH